MLIISDVHCPIHSKAWLFQSIKTAIHYGCTDVLINGDFIDATSISVHAGVFYNRRNQLEDDLASAESILKLLCENFDRVFLLTGNHDQRLIKMFGGQVPPERVYKLLGQFQNFKTTGRFFVDVNGGWRFVHPRQYSKIRGKLSQDLAMRWQKNIATGHQHHSARTISPCGKFQCVDIGALVDTEIQDYVRFEAGTYADPVNGFAILVGEDIMLFDKFTPYKLLGLPEFER